MANTSPTVITPEARQRGANNAARTRRTNAIIHRIDAAPPLRPRDLERIHAAVTRHPIADDTSTEVA